ncbi:hypothetical protein, conserved, partial [Eimeria tenella]
TLPALERRPGSPDPDPTDPGDPGDPSDPDPSDPNDPNFFPCGAQSVALFNDEITIKRKGPDGAIKDVPLNFENVAYEWDFLQFMVSNRTWESEGLEPWILPSNPKFRVWLHPPFTPSFQKLYAVLSEPLVPGEQYYAVLTSNKWPAEAWGAKKSFVITGLTPMGGANFPLAIFTLATGALCILLVLLLWVMKKLKLKFVSSTAQGVDLKPESSQTEGPVSPRSGDGGGSRRVVVAAPGSPVAAAAAASAAAAAAAEDEFGQETEEEALSRLLPLLSGAPSCLCPVHCSAADDGSWDTLRERAAASAAAAAAAAAAPPAAAAAAAAAADVERQFSGATPEDTEGEEEDFSEATDEDYGERRRSYLNSCQQQALEAAAAQQQQQQLLQQQQQQQQRESVGHLDVQFSHNL